MLALPHSGNWDHAGAWCGATGAPFTTVAERLQPESLYDRFVAFRSSLGMEVLALTGGPRPPFEVLVERLEAGGMLCLLADRDLSARGVEVEFFGATARMPAGPASLCLRTGATLVPVTLAFGARGRRGSAPSTTLSRTPTSPTMTQAARRRLRPRHRRAPCRLAHAAAAVARRPRARRPAPGPRVKVGLVCPYAWDVPGGVQAHVRDLAEPAARCSATRSACSRPSTSPSADLPAHVVPAGRSVPVPYNGSVARLCFGPLSLARTVRWLRQGSFDVLHVHEPTVPSVSMLGLFAAAGPVVATFHTATTRSRCAAAVRRGAASRGSRRSPGASRCQQAARRVVVEHLGGDAVLVPNGVEVARFDGAPRLPGVPAGPPTVVFLGRLDEPRKGLQVLLAALPSLQQRVPDLRVLVAGPGTPPTDLPPCVVLLGRVSEADKPSVYASGDVYCAPNTFGESFGIVLTEAMAAGTPVVASDLEGFRAVLDDGAAGALVPVDDPAALASALAGLLLDPPRRAALAAAGRRAVAAYDWGVVTRSVVEVYETVLVATPVVVDAALPSERLAREADRVGADAADEPVDVEGGGLWSALRRWSGLTDAP